MFKNTWDILRQTVAKEGFFALYKGGSSSNLRRMVKLISPASTIGMASPLLGIAAVNSLLFTAYGVTRRIISPYPELTMGQIAVAGAGAGAINAVLASPVSREPYPYTRM
jgi:solute carrier family 25 carnitine/acylcarnitine transporter 20/29